MTAGQSIVDAFARTVERCPDAVALSGAGLRTTYRQLDRSATHIAKAIVDLGLPAESRVAFDIPRGPWQVPVILAILQAGAAYLPLDRAYPPERLRFMLDDSDCRLVISSGGALPPHLIAGRQHIDLDRLPSAIYADADVDLPRPGERQLAYVIYTSGSTGQPKGVMVEHRGVPLLASSLMAFYEGYGIRRQYTFFSLAFDASVWEIFFSLLNGLELVVDADGPSALEPDELLDRLDRTEVDSFMTTPSFLARATPRPRPGIRPITVCGEACPITLARDWSRHHRFVNAYGPTENTVAATMSEVDGSEETMSIGWPLQHVRVHVLGEAGRPVADGQTGELYLAGHAVARGYQNRPELTDAAFVPDPDEPDVRMYRTGDLGLRRTDGQFEYLGRTDDQVKVRGFRIEPGEIEAVLREHPSVNDAAAVAFGEGANKLLAAFLVGDGELDADEVRAHLGGRLPHYMLPVLVRTINELPTLTSGKTDRRSLRERAAREYEGPADAGANLDLRSTVASFWKETLGRHKVADEDSFFELGGQSVLAARIVTQTRREFGIKLPLRTLFEHSTLGEYCDAVEAALTEQASA